MTRPDYLASYRQTLAHLVATHGEEMAMDLIVEFGQSVAVVTRPA